MGRRALSHVAEGSWLEAREELLKILEYYEDGPTIFQLKMLYLLGPEAPPDWPGYHILDDDMLNDINNLPRDVLFQAEEEEEEADFQESEEEGQEEDCIVPAAEALGALREDEEEDEDATP